MALKCDNYVIITYFAKIKNVNRQMFYQKCSDMINLDEFIRTKSRARIIDVVLGSVIRKCIKDLKDTGHDKTHASGRADGRRRELRWPFGARARDV